MTMIAYKKKSSILGVPFGTATARLRKSLLFSMAIRLKENVCFRCGGLIETEAVFTIEHKEAWMSHADPKMAFFNLENISFSHWSCNSKHASRPNKYSTEEERRMALLATQRRNQPNRSAKRDLWRDRRREQGLPYT